MRPNLAHLYRWRVGEEMRIAICPKCDKQIEVRSGFAHITLNNHLAKEHK